MTCSLFRLIFMVHREPGQIQAFRRIQVALGADAPLLLYGVRQQLMRHVPGYEMLSVMNTATMRPAEVALRLSLQSIGGDHAWWIVNEHEGVLHAIDTHVWDVCMAYEGASRMVIVAPPGARTLSAEQGLYVELDEACSRESYGMLRSMYSGFSSSLAMTAFAHEGEQRSVFKSVARAHRMALYEALLGARSEQFWTHWYDDVLAEKESLFTVAGHLLARDRRLFYAAWHRVQEQYPPEFWVTYVLELIWNSLAWVSMKQQGYSEKCPLKGLPFSFINRDWRKHTIDDLAAVYNVAVRHVLYHRAGATFVPELIFEQVLTSARAMHVARGEESQFLLR